MSARTPELKHQKKKKKHYPGVMPTSNPASQRPPILGARPKAAIQPHSPGLAVNHSPDLGISTFFSIIFPKLESPQCLQHCWRSGPAPGEGRLQIGPNWAKLIRTQTKSVTKTVLWLSVAWQPLIIKLPMFKKKDNFRAFIDVGIFLPIIC